MKSEPDAQMKQLLFFSRGKGRGHAVPDAAIAADLQRIMPQARVTFASYSTGAETLRLLGCEVVDMELPEENPLWETAIRASTIIQERKPDLIASHEEFCVMPLAKIFGTPALFMIDWFLPPGHPQMRPLEHAGEVLFLDDPGYYDEPPYLKGLVQYVGPVFRHLDPSPQDAKSRRAEWGIPGDAVLILVAPGGAEFHSEERAPVYDLLREAFELLPLANKRLVWIAGDRDFNLLAERSRECPDIAVIRPHGHFTATLLASDLIITKGNRTPILEADAFGIPSLSLSYGLNPIDDIRVSRVPSHLALKARGVTPANLKEYLIKALARGRRGTLETDTSLGRMAVAKNLARRLAECCGAGAASLAR